MNSCVNIKRDGFFFFFFLHSSTFGPAETRKPLKTKMENVRNDGFKNRGGHGHERNNEFYHDNVGDNLNMLTFY